ncbi:hypothetical protein K431DRAFT_43824 [Polychaeton citri CBS 116435]|uniref:Uncharacterized protein n=1 Tax=Polychaeton citri CBS 116435 TaxID=1314669 RepID=A0A9P4Q8T0_9PEZI|nr:hypothetical protein K431DRAFT_43824 [Polychaeton citri CBS 116435]
MPEAAYRANGCVRGSLSPVATPQVVRKRAVRSHAFLDHLHLHRHPCPSSCHCVSKPRSPSLSDPPPPPPPPPPAPFRLLLLRVSRYPPPP